MNIQQNFDLKNLNTFGISAKAKYFTEVESEKDFMELLSTEEFKKNNRLFLGGGSNVLFTKDWEGIVVLNSIKGIETVKENNDYIWLKSMSGEIWHDLVVFVVSHQYWGLENLSLIPGTVGAAPMQNIGAYGAELKDVMESLEAVEIETGEKKIFLNSECEFGYRDSIFKQKLKDKYFILSVTFKLSKQENKNISYKILKDYIEENKIDTDVVENISEAVSSIRRSKLPDPKMVGNAGSFFKNVFVEPEKLQTLLLEYPNMPFFSETSKDKSIIKIPAGWLIEMCGWKGKKIGNVGVHEKQSLVLINHGGATGSEIQELASSIIDSVYTQFGLKLVPEVNLI